MSETATTTQDAKTNGNGNQQLATLSPELSLAEHAVAIEERRFELAQRQAKVYAQSGLVPKEYQNNIGNVLIAQNMAKRMGADTLMVMQNLYIVHGKPGWSAAFLIASFNSNGRFSAIKYRFDGDPESDDYGCTAYCTEISTGDEITGTKITRKMAKKEGWHGKNGSKWQTMEDQMFRYRAATFLIRSTAPEIGMGLHTKDELEDMGNDGSIAEQTRGRIAELKERLSQTEPGDVITRGIDDAPPVIDAEIVDAEPVIDDTPPADTDAAADETEAAVEAANAGDDISSLRANVQAAMDALDNKQRKDLLVGKPGIGQMGVDDLNQLLIEIRKVTE